jgi:hypothetical protein
MCRPDQQGIVIGRDPKFIKGQFPSGVAVQGCEIYCVHVLLEFVVSNEQRFLVWMQPDIKMIPMAFQRFLFQKTPAFEVHFL